MDFNPTPEQRQVREIFARFCDERIAPQAAALDEAHAFPRALFGELAALGLFGMRYPEEAGGSGMQLAEFCIALEEVARGSMSLAGCAAMQSLMGTKFLHMLGNADIVERLFRPALRGEKIGAICMTEPNAGSDLDGIATRARRVDGGYVLDGQKTWVTSAPVADFFTVFAKAGEERKLTIFLVERSFAGLKLGRAIEKMGVWALPTSELAFDDCFVPDGHRLSQGGGGRRGAPAQDARRDPHHHRGDGRGPGARGARARRVRYAGERRQFGKPINRYQAIQMSLAEMATELEAATQPRRTARPGCATPASRTTRRRRWPSCSPARAARGSPTSAARVFASYGYAMEYPVQRCLRDVRFTLIGGGTSEILKLIIAKEVSAS